MELKGKLNKNLDKSLNKTITFQVNKDILLVEEVKSGRSYDKMALKHTISKINHYTKVNYTDFLLPNNKIGQFYLTAPIKSRGKKLFMNIAQNLKICSTTAMN